MTDPSEEASAEPVIEAQLGALAQTVVASTAGRPLPPGPEGEAAVAAIILAASLGRALELGVPPESIMGIFGQVSGFSEAAEVEAAAAGASTVEDRLEVWFDACGASVLERSDADTPALELFAMVYDFAAGTALGTGLTLDDAIAIVKRCHAQLAQAGAAPTVVPAPPAPAAASRRYDVPT